MGGVPSARQTLLQQLRPVSIAAMSFWSAWPLFQHTLQPVPDIRPAPGTAGICMVPCQCPAVSAENCAAKKCRNTVTGGSGGTTRALAQTSGLHLTELAQGASYSQHDRTQ